MDPTYKGESEKHQNLVQELVDKFESEYEYRIDAVDLEEWGKKPDVVENEDKIGDGKDKQPDIDAFDEEEERFIRGEAKTGDGDIDTQHSITQYLLFSNRSSTKNGKPSFLYIIVPAEKRQELKDTIVKNVPEENWENIKVVSSQKYEK